MSKITMAKGKVEIGSPSVKCKEITCLSFHWQNITFCYRIKVASDVRGNFQENRSSALIFYDFTVKFGLKKDRLL